MTINENENENKNENKAETTQAIAKNQNYKKQRKPRPRNLKYSSPLSRKARLSIVDIAIADLLTQRAILKRNKPLMSKSAYSLASRRIHSAISNYRVSKKNLETKLSQSYYSMHRDEILARSNERNRILREQRQQQQGQQEQQCETTTLFSDISPETAPIIFNAKNDDLASTESDTATQTLIAQPQDFIDIDF